MESKLPELYDNVKGCVDDVLGKVGKKIVLATPVAIGKSTIIANEFYRRAKEDPSISLMMCSGLTLHTPTWNSDLERRFIEPLVKRLFKDYPDPIFLGDALKCRLPDNVELREIYLAPGSAINNDRLQQSYISSNYTHVPREVENAGCNVTAGIIARRSGPQGDRYSLGSNADAAIMMFKRLREKMTEGYKGALIGQVNRNMPFMFGATETPEGLLSHVVDSPECHHQLFAAPHEPITATDYSIALHAACLIKDGGTFQVGFGSLGDAIIHCMQLRHENNAAFRKVLEENKILTKFSDVIESIGGAGPFDKGLYACSEFIFDGFIHLMNSGIIKRKVYPHLGLQKLVINEKIKETVSDSTLDILKSEGVISEQLTAADAAFLREFGIFKEEIVLDGGVLRANGVEVARADLSDPAERKRIAAACLGASLKKGIPVHAGFFLGSEWFYDTLRGMNDEKLRDIEMREIDFVNSPHGDQELKFMQRRDGRFVNTCMMATALGGVVSDTLEDGRVVSGVGGQYNFVSMAQDLPGGRSILVFRSCRDDNGVPMSNIVWSYGNLTIPRHLRDILVTEYGIADLRGKTDSAVIATLINVTDSRFQDELVRRAISFHKLPKNFKIPDQFRNNYPQAVTEAHAKYVKENLFPVFPYGTEFTKDELVLGKALKGLKKKLSLKGFQFPGPSGLAKIAKPPAAAARYLERLQLDRPEDFKQKVMRGLVLYALTTDGVI